MGASLFAAMPLPYALATLSAPVSIAECGELLHFLEKQIQPGAVLIIVSRSGESVEIVRLLDRVAGRSCRIIGITNTPGSTLARRSEVSLALNSPADQMVAIQTYTASVLLMALIAAAASGELDAAARDLHSSLPFFEAWVPELVAASPSWDSFASLSSPLYILGRGPALATAQEGALLMHETAKQPAIGMPVAQFRHGFVEAVDQEFRAVVLGSENATASLDRDFALDLTRMGAHVRWLGQAPGAAGVHPLGHWPAGVLTRFRQVFEVVPLQLLAYRAALAHNVVPGDFRWCSLVTGEECGFPGLTSQTAGQARPSDAIGGQ